MTLKLAPANSDATISTSFYEKIAKEFQKDGIDWRWVEEGVVRFLPSQEWSNGEITGYPVLEALNWEIQTRGYSLVPFGDACAFVDRHGTIEKVKPEIPRAGKDGKLGKYAFRKGAGEGSGWYIPCVPDFARVQIALRWATVVPMTIDCPDFWEWFNTAKHRIPLVITEGEKKALSGLQNGYVTIACQGINGGYRQIKQNGQVVSRELAKGILDFNLNREIAIAFDEDESKSTRTKTCNAMGVLGRLLEAEGANVTVIPWDSKDGKGMDDLISQSGIEAFEIAFALRGKLKHEGNKIRVDYSVNVPCLSKVDVRDFLHHKLLAIKAHKGTGKTKLVAKLLEAIRAESDLQKTINIVHRITLGTQIASRIGTTMRNDHESQMLPDEISFCLESIHLIDPDRYAGATFIIDECRQVMMHLLMSSTMKGHRNHVIDQFCKLLRGASQVILADADLTNDEIWFFELMTGARAFNVVNEYKHSGFDVLWYQGANDSAIRQNLWEHLENTLGFDGRRQDGKVTVVCSDSKDQTKTVEHEILKRFPSLRVLVINQETTGEDLVKQFIRNPDADILSWDIIIYSPTLGTGVSIEVMGKVDSVWGLFSGYSLNTPSMAQALSRVRDLVPRHVWVNDCPKHWKYSSSGSPKKIREILLQQTKGTIVSLQDAADLSQLKVSLVCDDYRDWMDSPFVDLYCRYIAADNRDGHDLRGNLKDRLEEEGNRLILLDAEVCPEAKEAKKEAKQEIAARERQELKDAPLISDELAKLWGQATVKTREQQVQLSKWRICDFYVIPEVTDEILDFHREKGEGRNELQEFRKFIDSQHAGFLSELSAVKAIENRKPGEIYDTPADEAPHKAIWDMDGAIARRRILNEVGIGKFLNPNRLFTVTDLEEAKKDILRYAKDIKTHFGSKVTESMVPLAVVQVLLNKMGVKFKVAKKSKGVKLYQVDQARLNFLLDILKRQQEKQAAKELEKALKDLKYKSDPSYLLTKKEGVEQILPDSIDFEDSEFTAQMIVDGAIDLSQMREDTPLCVLSYIQRRSEVLSLMKPVENAPGMLAGTIKVVREKVVEAVEFVEEKVEQVAGFVGETIEKVRKPKKAKVEKVVKVKKAKAEPKKTETSDYLRKLDVDTLGGFSVGDRVLNDSRLMNPDYLKDIKKQGGQKALDAMWIDFEGVIESFTIVVDDEGGLGDQEAAIVNFGSKTISVFLSSLAKLSPLEV